MNKTCLLVGHHAVRVCVFFFVCPNFNWGVDRMQVVQDSVMTGSCERGMNLWDS